MTEITVQDLLHRLGIAAMNSGSHSGEGWSQGAGAALIESRNPATGVLIAIVRGADASDYERVMRSAAATFVSWRAVPAPKRGELVRLIGDELRRCKQDLGQLVSMENGKILAEGLGEVQEMIDIADLAVGQARMLYGLSMHSERSRHRMMEQWHPLGVVSIISAFNFPVAVWAWNAFLAAICGNVSVWKPSAKTPLAAIAVQQICARVCQQHGYPAVFQLFIDAGTDLAQKFVADARSALVSFTGSTPVGRKIAQTVAARLGKSLLELGGNNAIIVDESADLKLAVPAIVFGAVGTAGQRCTSTRRVLVHESRLQELEKRLIAAYDQVRIGDPLDADTLMGPLIDAGAVEAYFSAIRSATSDGGVLLYGGKKLPRPGNFVEPAIVRTRNDSQVVQRETFAPVLYLIPWHTLDEAIALQNQSHYGLSSAIFTNNLRAAEQFVSGIGSDCGIANVNIGTSGAEIGGAFGGEKDTGSGRESGSDAWRAYMRRQTNTVNWSSELPLAQGIKFDLGG